MSVFSSSRFPCPEGGSYPSTVIPTGAKHRVQSPLERWPRTISTDRPEMESRPYEFLLQWHPSPPAPNPSQHQRTHQAPLSMEFSRQEYWSGLSFPSPGSGMYMSSSILALESFFFKAREWGLFAFVGCFCLFVCLFSIYFIWLHRVFIAKRHVGSQFPYRRLNLHPLQILNHWTTREAPGGS